MKEIDLSVCYILPPRDALSDSSLYYMDCISSNVSSLERLDTLKLATRCFAPTLSIARTVAEAAVLSDTQLEAIERLLVAVGPQLKKLDLSGTFVKSFVDDKTCQLIGNHCHQITSLTINSRTVRNLQHKSLII